LTQTNYEDSELVQKENQRIPEAMRSLIEASSNRTNRAIMLLLTKRGELSFKQLLGIFEPMNVSTLNYHLKTLLSAGAIQNNYKKKEEKQASPGKPEHSFYSITKLGFDFLKLIGAKL
jgi:DNA-binding transcriptional ArsR family regulator